MKVLKDGGPEVSPFRLTRSLIPVVRGQFFGSEEHQLFYVFITLINVT